MSTPNTPNTIQRIIISNDGRNLLIQAKRKYQIQTWNVLCRWGLALSLALESEPSETVPPKDSNLEMSWAVFGGVMADVYDALIRQRADRVGTVYDEAYLRRHIHRGLRILARDVNLGSQAALLSAVVKRAGESGIDLT